MGAGAERRKGTLNCEASLEGQMSHPTLDSDPTLSTSGNRLACCMVFARARSRQTALGQAAKRHQTFRARPAYRVLSLTLKRFSRPCSERVETLTWTSVHDIDTCISCTWLVTFMLQGTCCNSSTSPSDGASKCLHLIDGQSVCIQTQISTHLCGLEVPSIWKDSCDPAHQRT